MEGSGKGGQGWRSYEYLPSCEKAKELSAECKLCMCARECGETDEVGFVITVSLEMQCFKQVKQVEGAPRQLRHLNGKNRESLWLSQFSSPFSSLSPPQLTRCNSIFFAQDLAPKL